MANLQNSTPEVRYFSMRARLEEKWGPNSQIDAIDLRDKLSRLSGDVLGWETYCKKFTEIVKTLTKTLQRDEHGNIVRGPPPSMPFVPLPASPTSLLQREEYYYSVRDALARWVANPVLGLVLTHAPTELERKGILLRALGSSEQGGYSSIAAHYRLNENEDKPLSSIWKDLELHIQYEAKILQKSGIRPQSPYPSQLSSAMSQQGYRVDRHHSTHNRYNDNNSNHHAYNPSASRQLDRSPPEPNRKRSREDFVVDRTYDANSVVVPCKNCQGAHTTKECPSTRCSTCGSTFSSAHERKVHYVEAHGPKSNGVRFSKDSSGKKRQRPGTPRHSSMNTSNQFNQSMETDCTHSSKEGYESSAQDSVYSNDSAGRNSYVDYATEDSRDDPPHNYIFEARMQQCVNMATDYRCNPIVPPRLPECFSEDIEGVNWIYPCFMDIHKLFDVSDWAEGGDNQYINSLDIVAYNDGSYGPNALVIPPRHQTMELDTLNIEHAYTQSVVIPQPEMLVRQQVYSSEVFGLEEQSLRVVSPLDHTPSIVIPQPEMLGRQQTNSAEFLGLEQLFHVVAPLDLCIYKPLLYHPSGSENANYMQETVSVDAETWRHGATMQVPPSDPLRPFPTVFPLNRFQPTPPRRRYNEDEIAQLSSYFIWQGERTTGWTQPLAGLQWTDQSIVDSCEKHLRLTMEDIRSSQAVLQSWMRHSASSTRRWMNYRDAYGLSTELHTTQELINMVRVQTDDGEGYGPSYEDDDRNDDVMGIIDTGAQISTIPEMLVTVQRWINTRQASPEGTAIKYGNNEIQEVYNQIYIGSVLFHITPNRCSSPLISVCQLTALGHTVTFSNTEMCIDDATLQYGLRFGKLASSRDWKIPLSAIERLAKLRLAHPIGGVAGSSRRVRV